MTQRIVITGASRGIGRACALLAADRGLAIDLLGRDSDALRATVDAARKRAATVRTFHCDLVDRSSVDRALLEILAGPAPDLIIHNAGIVERALIHEQNDELWDRVMEVNLNAPMRITRAVLPRMLKQKRGRIVFVSSISAVLGTKSQSAYNASKAGLVAFMRCLAEELSGSPLSTMALLPGAVDTDMLTGSGFAPQMSAEDVAKSLLYYGLDAPAAHNGAAIEMFGV